MVLGSVAVGGNGIAELFDNFAVKANAEEAGYEAGDSIYLGKYPQSEITDITGLTKDVDYVTVNNKYYAYEPIGWKVLDANTGLCVSNYALNAMAFDDNSHDYAASNIRAWLYGADGTGTFYTKAFTDAEKSAILQKDVTTYKYNSTEVISTLTDKVFLLSVEEASNTKYFASDKARICYPTAYAIAKGAYTYSEYNNSCYWLLRSPGRNSTLAACVSGGGGVRSYGCSVGFGDVCVRPALYLNLESEITLDANNGTDESIKNTVTSFKSYYPECTFTNGTKTFCGWYKDAECQQPWTETDIVYEDMTLYAGWTTYKQGETIEFGSYPQSKVEDSDLISKLEAIEKKWVSYDYYTGTGTWDDGNMTSSDYMQYADFTYNGVEYRAVTFSKYRPYNVGCSSSDLYSYQDENGYTAGTNNIYYFKYEPIKWKILNPATGLVLSDVNLF